MNVNQLYASISRHNSIGLEYPVVKELSLVRTKLLNIFSKESINDDIYDFDIALEAINNYGVKSILDDLFSGVEFDGELLDELIRFNIGFITANPDVRDMMGSKLLGCFHISYTQYHKNIFYEDLFGMTYDIVMVNINKIKTIPKNFAVARDDINLVCFYIAHRFLNSKHLNKEDRELGAKEILNYFGYRTLITISGNWWMYPTTKEKAQSVTEILSRSYLITKLKNWNEYVHYRSQSYIDSKFLKLLTTLDNDRDLPNAINDLYNRYKDTIKHIYSEFMNLENNDSIKSARNVVSDVEGRDVLLDRIGDPIKYVDKVKTSLTDKDSFIQLECLEAATSIVSAISQTDLQECLEYTLTYYFSSPTASKDVSAFIEDFISDSIEYLRNNRLYLNTNSNVAEVVNHITGNILYARGADVTITEVKRRGEILIDKIYKKNKDSLSKRKITGVRNAFCIYILILALV